MFNKKSPIVVLIISAICFVVTGIISILRYDIISIIPYDMFNKPILSFTYNNEIVEGSIIDIVEVALFFICWIMLFVNCCVIRYCTVNYMSKVLPIIACVLLYAALITIHGGWPAIILLLIGLLYIIINLPHILLYFRWR